MLASYAAIETQCPLGSKHVARFGIQVPYFLAVFAGFNSIVTFSMVPVNLKGGL